MSVETKADAELDEALETSWAAAESLRVAEANLAEMRADFDRTIARARDAGATVDEVAEATGYSRQLVSKAHNRHKARG